MDYVGEGKDLVSACKEARSAHVEISKMDVQVEEGKERTVPKH